MKESIWCLLLNKAGIHWAWVGNHDFYHGVDILGELITNSGFPWLLSNVKCSKTGDQLSQTKDSVILEHEDYKIALIGNAEVEWIESLSHFEIDDIEFEDPIEWTNKYVK